MLERDAVMFEIRWIRTTTCIQSIDFHGWSEESSIEARSSQLFERDFLIILCSAINLDLNPGWNGGPILSRT